jgi:hypothetical protein
MTEQDETRTAVVGGLLGLVRLWWSLFWVAFDGIKGMDEALIYAQKQAHSRSGVHCKHIRAYHLWEDLDVDIRRLVADYRDRADTELRGVIVPGRRYNPQKGGGIDKM